jgi:hypothetical protein
MQRSVLRSLGLVVCHDGNQNIFTRTTMGGRLSPETLFRSNSMHQLAHDHDGLSRLCVSGTLRSGDGTRFSFYTNLETFEEDSFIAKAYETKPLHARKEQQMGLNQIKVVCPGLGNWPVPVPNVAVARKNRIRSVCVP